MKKYCFLPILLFFSFISRAQSDCKYAVSSTELLKQMSVKPLIDDVFYLHFNNKCNITNEVRKKMLYHLEWHWTKMEIDSYLEKYFNNYRNYYRVDTLVKEIGKGNDSLMKVAFDSLKKEIKAIGFSRINYKINDNIVLGVAYADIREAIPILQKAIKEPSTFNIYSVELALARFGDKNLQEKIIANCKNKVDINGRDWLDYFLFGDAEKLLFISSQESVSKLNEWMDTSKILYIQLASGRFRKYKASMFIISILRRTINNKEFQELTQTFSYEANDSVNDLLIINCKNWLLKNKGNFQMNNFTGVGYPLDEL